MDGVLAALGWPITTVRRLFVAGYIAALTALFTVAGYAIARPLGEYMFIVQLALWVPWLVWLGYYFPRDHLRPTGQQSLPYRRAFFLQVTPGISWNFAQMTRPGLAGLESTRLGQLDPFSCATGLVLVGVGALMIGMAIHGIGVGRAMFLGEYIEQYRRLQTSGIYGWIRHPLFFGGIVVSLGIGVFFLAPAPLGLALANLAVLPLYLMLEDGRCRKVFADYDSYQMGVGAVVPTASRHHSPEA